jgi:hypothetical protein
VEGGVMAQIPRKRVTKVHLVQEADYDFETQTFFPKHSVEIEVTSYELNIDGVWMPFIVDVDNQESDEQEGEE